MKDIAVQFGKNVRAKRKELGLSQDRLALIANIVRSYAGRFKRGEVNVTLVKAYSLAEILDCDIRELIP